MSDYDTCHLVSPMPLKPAEGLCPTTHGPGQQVALNALRWYWQFREEAQGAYGLSQALKKNPTGRPMKCISD